MKLLLYPYTPNNHYMLLQESIHKIIGVYVGGNWSIDKEFLMRQAIHIYSDLEEGMADAEGILIYPDNERVERNKKEILQEINRWLKCNKHVFCVMYLNEKEKSQLIKSGGKYFHYLGVNGDIGKNIFVRGELQQCTIPIVYIGEWCEGLQAKEFILNLSIELKQRGYAVHVVLDDVCAQIVGATSIPDFLYKNISENEKVFLFNKFIRELKEEISPDIILIQIPGNIYPLTSKYTDLAIYMYYLSKAFCPDIFLGILPDNFCDERTICEISRDLKMRFGYGIDGILRRNLYMDKMEAFLYRQIDLVKIQIEEKEQIYKCDDDQILVLTDGSSKIYKKFCDLIEKLLSEEIELF